LFFSCKTIIRLQERRKSTAATALSNLKQDSLIHVPVPPETTQSLAGETITESIEDEEENQDLQLPVQAVPITTNVVSLNPTQSGFLHQ
jgi:polysaccharide deacetylase 2 family uncharacterized protein YibQ